jgi:GT2 family glycosyltransferase
MGAAIGIGFACAMEQEFVWTWVLDPDGVPEPDALEKLLEFFERLPPSQKEQVYFLACRLGTGESCYNPAATFRRAGRKGDRSDKFGPSHLAYALRPDGGRC